MLECTICGNDNFKPGPGGRLSSNKTPPQCTKCGSLERHRIARRVTGQVRSREVFKGYRLLSIGQDPVAAGGWFGSVEALSLTGKNPIDLRQIDRPDGSYDFIACAHVIDSVEGPKRAIAELTRILSPVGLMFLSYPSPATREVTTDWGQADPKRGGKYRVFGRDFEASLVEAAPQALTAAINAVDDVTGDGDRFYIVTKNPFWARRLFQLELDAELLNFAR